MSAACDVYSDDGDLCILAAGHDGFHVDRRCDGTCDTCECRMWSGLRASPEVRMPSESSVSLPLEGADDGK